MGGAALAEMRRGVNAGRAADHNRGVVLRLIHRHRQISRTELAARSGLTKQAVARIVERLMGEGLVIETGRRRRGIGQPSIELQIDPDGACAIGISMARDHAPVVLVDALGAVRARLHREERFLLPDPFFAFVGDALADFSARKRSGMGKLAGVGLAIPDWLGEIPFPGMPDSFRTWSGVRVRDRLSAMTDAPTYIENDAIAAAIGELNYGLGLESRSFFYIFIGAGLGGCTVLDGVCHYGARGRSGEIGSLPRMIPGPGGGRTEPLGEILSLYGLYAHLARRGHPVSDPFALLELDPAGREAVYEWLNLVAGDVAEAVRNIGLAIDPDVVLVGGRLPVRFIDDLLLTVSARLRDDDLVSPPLHRALRAQDASALGAAAMPLAELLSLPSGDPNQRVRSPLGSLPPETAHLLQGAS